MEGEGCGGWQGWVGDGGKLDGDVVGRLRRRCEVEFHIMLIGFLYRT